MIETLGVLIALALLIILALRGVNVFLATLISSAIIAATNHQNLGIALGKVYVSGVMGFAGMFFLLFLTGAIFGRLMGESKAATSIALALVRLLGEQRTLVICTIAGALLTYGGVNVFIVIFATYPLALSLLQRSQIPKRLVNAAFSLGAGTFTMTALAGSPSIHNNIAANGLKTSLWAAWEIGLVATFIMFVLGILYLEREKRKARERGETFKPAPTDVIPKEEPDPSTIPHWALASAPLLIVVLTIIVHPLVAKWLGVEIGKPPAEPAPGFAGFFTLAAADSVLWTTFAMVMGCASALVLFARYFDRPMSIMGRGAEGAILPLLNTAAVIGFGKVVQETDMFVRFTRLLIDSDLSPIVSAAVAINVMSGIVGSSSGGLGIFMVTMKDHYLALGVDPETLHRVVTIGAGGLDSLPHCGAVITALTIMGMTHKEAYKDVFVVTVVIPLIALAVVVSLVLLMGGGTTVSV